MRIFLHRNFEKKYIKLSIGQKRKFLERRNLFTENIYHPLLNNHALKGKYNRYRSINIAGDLRVIYKALDAHTHSFLFVDIDTHDRLYSS